MSALRWLGFMLLTGCTPAARTAEATYVAELLACTAQAKATDAGRAGSEACEAEVDARWWITVTGKDGGR